MPWMEASIVEQRAEFVRLALGDGANRRELCRRFGICPATAYKWLKRASTVEQLGAGQVFRAFEDRSRRPHNSPRRSDAALEQLIVSVRDDHPAWGARKIARYLERSGHGVPADSTVHAILKRQRKIIPLPVDHSKGPYRRFERPEPNLLWQMDFKGHMPIRDGGRCHPLTVIDDHSRYAVCLKACANQQGTTVQNALTASFRRYGLPEAILVDNGSPWGDGPYGGWTWLGVWFLKLGIAVLHGRPYHPQTHGKNERFNRTLKDEVFALKRFGDLAQIQNAFDAWRDVYNLQRPHEALGHDVPASRYQVSRRAMPDRLPLVQYDPCEIVRTISTTKPYISFKGRLWKMPQAFCGERVALRPLSPDGHYQVCFGAHKIAKIDLT
jgi:transposase InsO family protein